MNPPAKESPAPVGSFTSSIGRAGARNGCKPMPNAPSPKKMVAPYSLCFTTSADGPMARTFCAARGRFVSPASILVSVSLISRVFTSFRGSRSSLGVPAIQKVGVALFLGNARMKFLEYVQFGEICLGFVQVVEILSTPAKSFSLCALDATRVDAAILEYGFVFRGKVVADDCDHAYVGEVAGGEREISCGATKNVFHAAGRRRDCVKGNGTYYEYAHGSPETCGW